MTTSYVIKDSIEYIYRKLSEFNIVRPYVYMPDLVFSKIHNSIVQTKLPDLRSDVYKTLPKEWVITYWNRSNISLQQANKRINALARTGKKESPIQSSVHFKQANLSISLLLTTNYIDYAERLEEILLIRFPTFSDFESDFKQFGKYMCSIDNFSVTSWDKLDHNQFGSILCLPITYTVNYLIFDEPVEAKLIYEINFDEYWMLYGAVTDEQKRIKIPSNFINHTNIKAKL